MFHKTPFEIYKKNIPSPFLDYHNRTVNKLLRKKHYSSLRVTVEQKYHQFLHRDISDFMSYLVKNSDLFYLKFLNKNGEDHFCRFGLIDNRIYHKRGIYLYTLDSEIVYIGRCRDSFYKRFNINYGRISPINCYKEGQSTNTHMNSLMNLYGDRVQVYLCILSDDEQIIEAEKSLISQIQPAWNRRR